MITFGISKVFLICFIINGKSTKVRYTLYRVLYDIRYIKIFLNIMILVLKKKFGKSRVRYIMGSLYRGQTVYNKAIVSQMVS